MQKFNVGDRVRLNDGLVNDEGTIVSLADKDSGFDYLIKRDTPGRDFWYDWKGHPNHTIRYASARNLTLVKAAPPVTVPKARKIKSGSQSDMLLKHLLQGKTITRIQADHLYRIASLTRRICDLKDAGHNIKAITKIDPTGRPYVEYSLLTRDRFGNQKKAA